MTDIGALGLTVTSDGLVKATDNLGDFKRAADTAARGADKLSADSKELDAALGALGKSSNDAGKKTREATKEFEALRTKFDPIFAASKQYESQLEELNRAQSIGAVTGARYDAALEQLNSQLLVTAGAANTYGTAMRSAGAHTANLTFQFQDIAMMLAAGQNPLMLAMQQGTQISGIFMQMGASAQTVGPMLAQAFMSLVSPMSLLTIGVIAGGAALFQWGMSAFGAGANAKTFAERIDEAQAAIDHLNEVTDLYSQQGLASLAEKYGEVNAEILKLIENQRILAMQSAIQGVQDALSGLTGALGDGLFSTKVGDIAAAFETTSDRARGLYDVMRNISEVEGPDRQLAVIMSLQGELSAVTNGFTEMTGAQAQMLQLLIDAEDQMRQLAAATPDQSWMNPAIAGVNSLIARLGVGFAAARQLKGDVNGPATLPMNTGTPLTLPLNEAGFGVVDGLLPNIKTVAETARGGVRELRDEMEKVKKVSFSLSDSLAGVFTDALVGAKSLQDGLQGLLKSMASLFLNAAFKNVFASIMPNVNFGGFRAAGGPVSAGTSYIVGEKGPELFTPSRSGGITPNNAMGGGTVVQINNYSGAQVREQRSRGIDGREYVKVIVGEALGGGDYDKQLGRYGATPAMVKR